MTNTVDGSSDAAGDSRDGTDDTDNLHIWSWVLCRRFVIHYLHSCDDIVNS